MEHIFFETKQRSETITSTTRLNDNKYGSWKAFSVGSAPVEVDGLTLQPGEGIEHNLQPDQVWKEPIDIKIMYAGGAVRLMRELCTPYVKDIKTKERK